jgi:hypothetical protein
MTSSYQLFAYGGTLRCSNGPVVDTILLGSGLQCLASAPSNVRPVLTLVATYHLAGRMPPSQYGKPLNTASLLLLSLRELILQMDLLPYPHH